MQRAVVMTMFLNCDAASDREKGRPQQELGLPLFDCAAGDVHVLARNRVPQLLDRELVGIETIDVGDDMDIHGRGRR